MISRGYLMGLAMIVAAPHIAVAQDGDAAAGEQVFNRCQQCHVVTDDEGNTLAGRSGRVGPNLYGIVNRVAGTVDDFRYSTGMVDAGEAGLAWNESDFVTYVQDPSGFLTDYLGERERGKMTFQLRDEQEAHDVWAYLAQLSGEGSGEGPGEHAEGSGS